MDDAAVIEQLAGSRPITRLTHARQRTSGVVGVLWRGATAIAICAHRCQLARLPGAIGELSGLERLDIGDNQLTELPALAIDELTGLRELSLRNNRLAVLPASIGALARLRTLDLRGNQLDELPEALLDLPLTKLDLRWSSLRTPPRWLDELSRRGCVVYT